MNVPTYFAKIENSLVTAVHVVEWEFLVSNPQRYGDSSLWIEVFPDGQQRGYCSIGWTYDAESDKFVPPPVEE